MDFDIFIGTLAPKEQRALKVSLDKVVRDLDLEEDAEFFFRYNPEAFEEDA